MDYQKTTLNQGLSATSPLSTEEAPVKYCLYARKSTEDDEKQALSIDSQIKEMEELAEKIGLEVVETKKESHSAKKSGDRPIFNKLIDGIKQGLYQGILTWAPDRLSRNAGDLGILVDLIDYGHLREIRTYGQNFSNKPNDKFLLMILCSQAKLENDCKSENVKRGLRAKCAMGWRPGLPPLGYLHDKYADKGKRKVLLDPKRAPIIKQMFEKVAYESMRGRQLFHWLNYKIKFRSRAGKRITLSTIYQILSEHFYYGKFEYPKGSSNWYKGGYEPIITEELFNQVRAKLLVSPRRHPGTNEYDFTKLFTCGNCGSGITAEEKFKKISDGTRRRYVYYHCSRFKNEKCNEKYIREEELLKQLLEIIDKIDVDEIKLETKMEREIMRYRKFYYGVLNQVGKIEKRPIDVDIRNYAKYVLIEGSRDEKREILNCLRSKLELKDKTLYLKITGKII